MMQLLVVRAVVAVVLVALSFWLGRSTSAARLLADCAALVTAAPAALNNQPGNQTALIPAMDVPGEDIVDLPRYPGAVRVEYRQSTAEQLLLTEVEYVVAAPLDTVRDFYREIFYAQGWSVADLGFYQGEWTFFVIMDEREAHVEVEARGELVEVELELSEPQGARRLTTED